MVRTRYSTPEMVMDDPVVEIHESQLRWLRAKANLAIPGVVMGLFALALIVAGVLRVEKNVRALQALAEGRSGVVAQQVEALNKQLAERTDPELITRLALQANAGAIEDASTTARQALSVARQTAASIGPVTEQLSTVDDRLADMRSEIEGLSAVETNQGTQIAEVTKDLTTLRASHEQRLESLNRQIASHDSRLNFQDEEVRSAKKWTRVATAGAAVGLGIVGVHTLGHSGR